jgi:hypothetical protein
MLGSGLSIGVVASPAQSSSMCWPWCGSVLLELAGVVHYFNSFSQTTVCEPSPVGPRAMASTDSLHQFYCALSVENFASVSATLQRRCEQRLTHRGSVACARTQGLMALGVVKLGDLGSVTEAMLITAGMPLIQRKRLLRALAEGDSTAPS